MKSIKATGLSFLAREAFGATATTLEKAGAELSGIGTTNIAISYSIDTTLVETTFSIVLTLEGNKVFSTTQFDNEQAEVFVCVSDGTDHNCLVSSLAIDSSDGKVYTNAWAHQLTQLPAFTDNEIQKTKFASIESSEKAFSAEIDTVTEGIKGSVTATGTSSEWSAVAESWSRSSNSWKVELKRSHTAGSSEDAKVFLDGLREGMKTVTAGMSYYSNNNT